MKPNINPGLSIGEDCRKEFRNAYENRYTWDSNFPGYQGNCLWKNSNKTIQGNFVVDKELKSTISLVSEPEAVKAFTSQLWEVTIHRVRRDFDDVHGQNTFTCGDTDNYGTEIIVGGKNKGDKYRINNNIVTMVYRKIHGKIVQIYTQSTIDTGYGYLSHTYTSQYLDPLSRESVGPLNNFKDTFCPLFEDGPWVLTERVIETENNSTIGPLSQSFYFTELSKVI